MNTNLVGTTISYLNRQYRVTAYEPSRPKFPYTVERIPDGKRFKMPSSIVDGTPVGTKPYVNPTVTPVGIPAVGSTFTSKGTEYRVTGYNPSRPKFPVSATRVRDGAPFKFTLAACGGMTPGASTVSPSTTAPTLRIGDRVEFDSTKRGGGVISGTVKSVNAKSVTLTDTSDGHPVGWRVTPGMLRSSTSPAPVASPKAPVPTVNMNVGQAVNFTAGTWASKFAPVTCTGVVTLVDRAKGEVEVYSASLPMGSKRFLSIDVTLAPKRSDKEIVKDAGNVYSMLSPENLTCDGERARADVNRIYASLQRALRALEIEAGRTITEDESYKIGV